MCSVQPTAVQFPWLLAFVRYQPVFDLVAKKGELHFFPKGRAGFRKSAAEISHFDLKPRGGKASEKVLSTMERVIRPPLWGDWCMLVLGLVKSILRNSGQKKISGASRCWLAE
jgi:hypothetical protein